MRTLLWLPLLLVLALPLRATQVVQVTPQNPTDSDVVTLQVTVCGGAQVTHTGHDFRLDVFGGCVPILMPVPYTLGRLPPGNYTYAVHRANELLASGSFVVAPGAPALSRWMLLAMAVLLSAVGYVSIRR